MPAEIRHYAMDAGSIPNKNFAWSRDGCKSSDDLAALVTSLNLDLQSGSRVTFGYECPLFWPFPPGIAELGRQRPGEDGRAWLAGAGATVTPTGIQALAYIMQGIAKTIGAGDVSFDWADFVGKSKGRLFVWEAFASNKPKAMSHGEDVKLIQATFAEWIVSPTSIERVTALHPFCLAGAVVVWSGIDENPALIRQSCLVLKVRYPTT